jgi:hypothetical protein
VGRYLKLVLLRQLRRREPLILPEQT